MAIPILKTWKRYFTVDRNEGLGSSYERVVFNLKLEKLRKKYSIKSAIECPSFGFTGMSGINLMNLAKSGVDVQVFDNDNERVNLIQDIWNEVGVKSKVHFIDNFAKLPLKDRSIDFAWNFSALWFVEDLDKFTKELDRVVDKAIILCVPNRSGFGYLSQKYISGVDLRKYLNEDYIIPKNVIASMKKQGWKLVDRNYIDCPPWPDIGMTKEEFLRMFGLGFLVKNEESEIVENPITILDYYSGKDPDFAEKMQKYMWFEKIAPKFIKALWAHHKYMLFERV